MRVVPPLRRRQATQRRGAKTSQIPTESGPPDHSCDGPAANPAASPLFTRSTLTNLAMEDSSHDRNDAPIAGRVSEEIIVVSGLPRSGTSLMMQMLAAGGIEPVTDRQREADADNPRGYFEIEAIKQLKQDASWLADARGKAVKAVSQLLFDLPPTERYRIIFMERDLDEVLTSQETMLVRMGRTAAPRERMREAFKTHLGKVAAWLERQPNMTTLRVEYAALVTEPLLESQRISVFLGHQVDAATMAEAVDPTLYRNRF